MAAVSISSYNLTQYANDQLLIDSLYTVPVHMYSGMNASGFFSTNAEWSLGYTVAGDEPGVQYLINIQSGATTSAFSVTVSGGSLSTTTNAYTDQYLLFISGALNGQKRKILTYTPGIPAAFTTDPFQSIPVNGAQCVILDPTPSKYIELQKYGGEAITAAAITGNAQLLADGFKYMLVGVGYLRELTTTYPQLIGTPTRNTFSLSTDNFHSTELFIESTLRALRLLEENAGFGAYQRAADIIRESCYCAARWMACAAVLPTGENRNLPYTHRRFLSAAGWLLAWQKTGDRMLYNSAVAHITDGLTMQLAGGASAYTGGYRRKVGSTTYNASGGSQDTYAITFDGVDGTAISRAGVMPEVWNFPAYTAAAGGTTANNSGWDCSYQNVSIFDMVMCYELLPTTETYLRSSLLSQLVLACAFSRSLIRPSDHKFETAGSTRVGAGDTGRSGTPKKPDYVKAVPALVYASKLVDTTLNHNAAQTLSYGQAWTASLPG